MAQSRHIIKVEQSRERILFGVCLRVSQLLNICSVPKDAVFLQENDNSIPLANMVGVEFWRQVPHNAGINKLAKNIPMPDGEMERKAEKSFMAGCVRFWEWIPGAASCSRRQDSMQGVSQICISLPDPTDWNRYLPGMPINPSVWGGPRN